MADKVAVEMLPGTYTLHNNTEGCVLKEKDGHRYLFVALTTEDKGLIIKGQQRDYVFESSASTLLPRLLAEGAALLDSICICLGSRNDTYSARVSFWIGNKSITHYCTAAEGLIVVAYRKCPLFIDWTFLEHRCLSPSVLEELGIGQPSPEGQEGQERPITPPTDDELTKLEPFRDAIGGIDLDSLGEPNPEDHQ